MDSAARKARQRALNSPARDTLSREDEKFPIARRLGIYFVIVLLAIAGLLFAVYAPDKWLH